MSLNRLFTTATAAEAKYAWVKPVDHFINLKPFQSPDKADHHSIFTANKKPKLKKADSQRDKKKWILIHSAAIHRARLSEAHAYIVTSGEYYKFAFGGPKYRLQPVEEKMVSASKKPPKSCYASEVEEGYQDFFAYSRYLQDKNDKNLPFEDKDIPEDIGRVTLTKWLFEEDDATLTNFYMAKGHFGAIDPARTFGSLTIPLYAIDPKTKLIQYDISHFDNLPKKFLIQELSTETLTTWIVDGMTANDMGKLHAEDYKTFPRIKYRLPANWELLDMPHYCEALSKNPRFRNECSFQSLHTLITKSFYFEFNRIHMAKHAGEQTKLNKLIKDIFTDFFNIVKNSKEFLIYLQKNRIAAVKTILYEIQDFLAINRHYTAADKEAVFESVLNEFSQLLKDLQCVKESGLKPKELSGKELSEFRLFIRGIQKNDRDCLGEVENFYTSQEARIRAAKVAGKKLASAQGVKSFGQFAMKVETKEHKDPTEPRPLGSVTCLAKHL